jgi:2-oxoglutarate dehydrogenase E1 component
MIGAEKVMTMTSTYDHRIIQGAESGQFLKVVEDFLQGENGFYEGVFSSLGVQIGPAPEMPAPAAAAAAARESAAPPRAARRDGAASDGMPSEELLQAVQAATSLLKAHRTHGHLAARLDPLGTEPEGDPALDPEPLGLTPELMAQIPAKILRMHVPGATLADALPHLRETYCGTIAYEIEHIASHRQRTWLRERIESGAFRSPLTNDEAKALLKRLVEVDAFERFMHKAYLGQKQFSVEGLDMTVPDARRDDPALRRARRARGGHRHGPPRALNVLAHNLGRPYETIFAEFEGASTLEAITTIPQGGTGDVKYHHGAQGSYGLPDGESILVNLESNPSHLEYVHPVVVGAARAAQTTRKGPHAHRDTSAAVPIVLHGDAAFPGQGVVAESLNLQALDGYQVGGSLHLIQNNQVGFTTDPEDSRSTRWASDLAKGYDCPIIHVNATTCRRASPPCGWPSPTARSSATTWSSTSSATAASATTRPTSPPTRSPRCTRDQGQAAGLRALRPAPGGERHHDGGGRRGPAPGDLGPPHRACTRSSRPSSRRPRAPRGRRSRPGSTSWTARRRPR